MPREVEQFWSPAELSNLLNTTTINIKIVQLQNKTCSREEYCIYSNIGMYRL